jgi:hypothetical protein
MSDPKKPAPKKPPADEDLLEFLGGIDQDNDESHGENFSDFLANADIEKIAAEGHKPKAPPQGEKKP